MQSWRVKLCDIRSYQLLCVGVVLEVPLSTPDVCCVCSVKPEVLEVVAPLMRTLRGHSLCIHARVDDTESGFNGDKVAKESEKNGNALMHTAKPVFECAEVGYMRRWH